MHDNPLERSALILNASFETIGTVSVQRAIILILSGRAEYVESDEELEVHSPSITFPLPVVIRLITYVKLPYRTVGLSRKAVFARDGMKCVYCGATDSLTLDHLLPRSLGGMTEWSNLVTACADDNKKKSNRTLEELGWQYPDPLPHQPLGNAWRIGFSRKIDPRWEPYL